MTFGVDPDTHIDSLEQAEHATVEGTSKWSCKLTITGTHTKTFQRHYRIKLNVNFLIPYLIFVFLTKIIYCEKRFIKM